MANHREDEVESTYRFGMNLGREPEKLDGLKGGISELVRQAETDQVANSAVVDTLRAIEGIIGTVADDARGWQGMFRTGAGNRRDVRRVENPRKNPRAEGNADAGKAARDV